MCLWLPSSTSSSVKVRSPWQHTVSICEQGKSSLVSRLQKNIRINIRRNIIKGLEYLNTVDKLFYIKPATWYLRSCDLMSYALSKINWIRHCDLVSNEVNKVIFCFRVCYNCNFSVSYELAAFQNSEKALSDNRFGSGLNRPRTWRDRYPPCSDCLSSSSSSTLTQDHYFKICPFPMYLRPPCALLLKIGRILSPRALKHDIISILIIRG